MRFIPNSPGPARTPALVLLMLGTLAAAGHAQLTAVEQLLNRWQTPAARAELQKSLDRNRADHLAALGRVLAQEGNYGEAQAELQKATQLAPSDPDPWIHLGEVRLAVNQQAPANQAFEQARQLAEQRVKSSRDKRNLYLLGVAQQRTKRYGEAIRTLSEARDKDPNDAMVLYQMGATHAFQEHWGEAIDLLTKALERDPGLAYAYYYRGLSHSRTGRKDLLINDLSRFLQLAPKAPEAPRARRLVQSSG